MLLYSAHMCALQHSPQHIIGVLPITSDRSRWLDCFNLLLGNSGGSRREAVGP